MDGQAQAEEETGGPGLIPSPSHMLVAVAVGPHGASSSSLLSSLTAVLTEKRIQSLASHRSSSLLGRHTRAREPSFTAKNNPHAEVPVTVKNMSGCSQTRARHAAMLVQYPRRVQTEYRAHCGRMSPRVELTVSGDEEVDSLWGWDVDH
ncbi:hypothetical protein D9611_012835 [Ephemerocybe angulata]|uniref:Uncharacterized protein n=1 Tax=Ephemerocybe angulata TaxID=980116 RepID=A0A8H5F166_9AGAR|nr:hypothetical protein D9611_012835 [Tulosesus angulatus]